MRMLGAVLVLVALAMPRGAGAEEFNYQAIQDARKVAEHLKADYRMQFDGGPLQNGTAVYNTDRDLAFWVQGDTIYAVNDRAREAAPGQPPAPPEITYAAVCDASVTDDTARAMRPTDIAMKGYDMSAEEAGKLEEKVRTNPDDVWARTVLLGYYGTKRFTSDTVKRAFEQNVLWLVKNAPEAPVVGSSEAHLDEHLNPEAYAEAEKLMKEYIAKAPKNLRLLANASEFFLISDHAYAAECLKKCIEIEPNNPHWHERLGFLHSLQSQSGGFLGMAGSVNSGTAKEALAEQERALELTPDSTDKTSMMEQMAGTAFAAGDTEKAKKYAAALIEGASKGSGWDQGNCIYTGNTILGRIALKEGDVEKAKQYLLAAGKCGGSPQLNSFGPDMTFASELLAKGERDTVIKFLGLCGGFWNKAGTDKWIDEIKKGQTPELNTMIAGMPDAASILAGMPPGFSRHPMPDGWDKPLVTLALPNKALEMLDTLYGVPLLVVLALVLVVSLFSNRQHLWILAPLAFVYAAPQVLNFCLPEFSTGLFGLEGGRFQHLVSTYFGSLALLWLLSDVLSGMKTWARVPAAVLIMGVAGLLGAINYPHRYHVIAEIGTFIIVVMASFTLARVSSPGRYSPRRFLSLLFVFCVSLMLVLWPVVWVVMMGTVFGTPPIELVLRVPQHLLIALVNGVGLFVFLIPFLLLAAYVPHYREQFRKVLDIEEG